MRHLKCKFVNWIYSWFNQNKYLVPISDRNLPDTRTAENGQNAPVDTKSYAVIYGASNKAGKSYAYYLMSKGFHLILVNREMESI